MKKANHFTKYLLVCLLLVSTYQLNAAAKRDTLRVLFIGNSYVYYNNLAQMISLISDSMDTKLICTKSTIGNVDQALHYL